MLSLIKPSNETCEMILAIARSDDFNHSHLGCLKTETPRGFNRDQCRNRLGTGQAVWDAAVESFNQWRFMPSSMVEIKNAGPIELNRVVGVLVKVFVVWSFNPARIIEVHGSSTPSSTGTSTFGFTYGTVRGHVEAGEERFLLTWDHVSNEVFYELEAVSRPKHFLAWLVYPYSRILQARFRKESCASVFDSVQEIQQASPSLRNSK